MRAWRVGGALIRHGDGLVLCGNRRRDQRVEWTPPGGVIDHGETVHEGLAREVLEETGLVVVSFGERAYRVSVEAPDMDWSLEVEAWETVVAEGEIVLDDPDGIVEEVRHASGADALSLLVDSPPWVQIPVADWVGGAVREHYRFVVRGSTRASSRVERIH